jgi:hypothetical protein
MARSIESSMFRPARGVLSRSSWSKHDERTPPPRGSSEADLGGHAAGPTQCWREAGTAPCPCRSRRVPVLRFRPPCHQSSGGRVGAERAGTRLRDGRLAAAGTSTSGPDLTWNISRRDSRQLTQSDVAREMTALRGDGPRITQGYVSTAEAGAVSVSGGASGVVRARLSAIRWAC